MNHVVFIMVELQGYLLISESGSGSGSSREVVRLKKQLQQLSEENNLLKFKNELLMDMVWPSL